jgi:hypothetical protein
MNERIRELAEQAAGNFTEIFKWDYLPEIDKDIFEKFAELIVKECIGIAYEYDEPKLSGPGMIIGNRIEEHFGVEE